MDRHRGLCVPAARRRPDVRPGPVAGHVVVQDTGQPARISALSSADVAEGSHRAGLPAAAAALHGDHGGRDHARARAGPPRRHPGPDDRSGQSEPAAPGADRQAGSRAPVRARDGKLHRAAGALRLPAVSRQLGLRDGGRDPDHASDQLHGGLCPFDLRVQGQERRHADGDRHADDPDHHHPGAGLSGGDQARARQFALGRDPAGRRDTDRRVSPAPVHADPAARSHRGRPHGQGIGVADLLAHRDSADPACARRPDDLLDHVALERVPVAARRPDEDGSPTRCRSASTPSRASCRPNGSTFLR